MGSMVWKVMGTGSAVLAAVVARKVVHSGWYRATGKNPPTNPASPDTDLAEAIAFAVATGAIVGVARMLATRKAAQYFQKSAGHLPDAAHETSKKGRT